jgi:hypothetical protein
MSKFEDSFQKALRASSPKTPKPKARVCMGSGSRDPITVQDQMRAETICSTCGRWLKLRKNASGFAAQEALIPRHTEPVKPYRP